MIVKWNFVDPDERLELVNTYVRYCKFALEKLSNKIDTLVAGNDSDIDKIKEFTDLKKVILSDLDELKEFQVIFRKNAKKSE